MPRHGPTAPVVYRWKPLRGGAENVSACNRLCPLEIAAAAFVCQILQLSAGGNLVVGFALLPPNTKANTVMQRFDCV